MIKFFKEIISSIKEGIDEAKQELAEEKAIENIHSSIDESLITNIPYIERFGTALGAPFRVVIFADWFTLFKSIDKENEDYYPIHLYSFGEYPKLEEFKKEFIKKLKIDFEIIDNDSCLKVLSSFFDKISISKENTIIKNIEKTSDNIPFNSSSETKYSAVTSCIISHIITASTDVGYINKEDVLTLLNPVIQHIKKHYNNWEDYSTAFMEEQLEIKLNNLAGTSVLKKYIGYLISKKGSPWNNISWQE